MMMMMMIMMMMFDEYGTKREGGMEREREREGGHGRMLLVYILNSRLKGKRVQHHKMELLEKGVQRVAAGHNYFFGVSMYESISKFIP